MKRDPQEIKLPDRILRFQRKQRNLVIPQKSVHIRPRRKDPLTPGILPAVEQFIQDLDPQVRHPDLIDIRKTHREPDRYFFILAYCVHLISQISRRLLYLQKQLVRQCQFRRFHACGNDLRSAFSKKYFKSHSNTIMVSRQVLPRLRPHPAIPGC